mgnify:FL=1
MAYDPNDPYGYQNQDPNNPYGASPTGAGGYDPYGTAYGVSTLPTGGGGRMPWDEQWNPNGNTGGYQIGYENPGVPGPSQPSSPPTLDYSVIKDPNHSPGPGYTWGPGFWVKDSSTPASLQDYINLYGQDAGTRLYNQYQGSGATQQQTQSQQSSSGIPSWVPKGQEAWYQGLQNAYNQGKRGPISQADFEYFSRRKAEEAADYAAGKPGSKNYDDPYWFMRATGLYEDGREGPAQNTSSMGSTDLSSALAQIMASVKSSAPQYNTQFPSTTLASSDIMSRLNDLMNKGGAFNKDLVNNQIESARENLEASRTGQMDQIAAELADRGLIGSGENINALTRMGTELGKTNATNVRDIYSNEMKNASDRYAQALSLATGMSIEDAKNAVAMAGIQSSANVAYSDQALRRELGLGQLNLDTMLGLGNLDVARFNAQTGRNNSEYNYDLGLGGLSNQSDSNQVDILRILSEIFKNSQGGYQGA